MMRLAALVILLATPALGDEIYTFTVPQNKVDNFVDPAGRVVYNERTCNTAGLPLNCTEVQLQAVPGFESTRIYPDSLQGRSDWIFDQILLKQVDQLKAGQAAWDKERAKIEWDAKSRAEKDVECLRFNRLAGCELFS